MKYLCLIYLSEQEMDAMPGGLRTKGTFIEAEALPAGQHDGLCPGPPGEDVGHRRPLHRGEGEQLET